MRQQKKPTFNDTLKGLEKINSQILMNRARIANRLAKRTSGRNKQRAYSVKHKALATLVHFLPDQIDIRKDIVLTDFVVVELKNSQFGLHMFASAV